ncbi:RDD family protein [Limnohabitans sp. 15K]|uniref:RDD family protein n=1 Tax=Limnohabitans sp. 15K TaxID=1100706 RepID=UPI001E41F073|nr:RDD family protein [Limnohabitans sp. 15K]
MTVQGLDFASLEETTTPSLMRRMACWLYEGMLLFGVMVSSGLVYFVAAYWVTGLAPGEMNVHPQLKSGLQASSFLVLGLYFIWMWRRGQTLAMKTWRIQIVDSAGQKISRKTAFKRYLASWLWFLPPLAASSALGLPPVELAFLTLGWITVWGVLSRFHPQRQFWHDAFAGTRLITVQN